MSSSDALLAQNWKKSKVLRCHDGKERLGLVCFLRERYEERFFGPIQLLTEAPGSDRGYGFAIMSLCCLLIEVLECYRLGWPSSAWKELKELAKLPTNANVPEQYYKLVEPLDSTNFSSEIAFKRFFSEKAHLARFPDLANKGDEFYKMIRCGLLHQAQTKNAWRILTIGKYWKDAPSEKTINRREFASRLENCFMDFLEELENGEWDNEPWKSARKKIWWLAQTS